MNRSTHRSEAGLTLVEVIVTIVILAIALTGLTVILQSTTSQSADTLLQVRTVALAEAYLDEILGKRFDENSANRGVPPCRAAGPAPQQCTAEGSFGPDGGENRSLYDDVDDYHGLVQGDGELTPLQDAEGNTRSGYENFSVSVTVRYINLGAGEEEENLAQGSELDDELDAKLISVAVSHRSLSDPINFSAYKANF